AAECLASQVFTDTAELEHHASGLDVGDPPLRGALTGPHPGFGRLLGQRAVGEDVDPHLPATLDVPVHGDTGRLDLAVGDVGTFQGMDSEVTDGGLCSALV